MKLDALETILNEPPCQQLSHPVFEEQGIECWIKRDDLIHPVISGNKWRKLKYILQDVKAKSCKRIVSMGGAYSNHLHALAYVGKELGIRTAAYVRGERPVHLNPTLTDLVRWDMDIIFISRSEYRALRQFKQFDAFPGLCSEDYWLPEGGASPLALQGVQDILQELPFTPDYLIVPAGTGTTAAGLIGASSNQTHVIVIAALKGAEFLREEIYGMLNDPVTHWSLELGYHFGGFAKTKPALDAFIIRFEQAHGIELEPVYSGKMFYALYDLVQSDRFERGARIVALHTGGLQGRRQHNIVNSKN